MAQGLIKSKSIPKPKPTTSTSKITKKGSRTIAPKNPRLARQARRNKKLTGSLINDTEKMLGARAGHLEMLGQKSKKGDGEKEKFAGKKKPRPKSDAAGGGRVG